MEQSRGSMDKNRITRPTRPDEQAIDCEVHVIKGRAGKSGERAAKAVDLTSGGLRCVSASGKSIATMRVSSKCKARSMNSRVRA